MSIGKRLKLYALTEFKELNIFAKKLQTSNTSVSHWVNNVKIPGGEYLQRMANLGLNVQWLLTGDGNMLIEKSKPDSPASKGVENKIAGTIPDGMQRLREQYPDGPEAFDEMIAQSRVEITAVYNIITPKEYRAAATPQSPKRRIKDEDIEEDGDVND